MWEGFPLRLAWLLHSFVAKYCFQSALQVMLVDEEMILSCVQAPVYIYEFRTPLVVSDTEVVLQL
ncbi:hypothetical protein BT93_J0016 [Corymbia citriodora subsp. variegata]|nr:hypothetical protein BT93_J0016 [Corymbia citriodora subsp. variegata]